MLHSADFDIVQVSGGGRAGRGIARGADLLDRLDEIRHALLCGAMARESLADLRRHVQARRPLVDDARLGAILDEIDLRASVELAKLGLTP